MNSALGNIVTEEEMIDWQVSLSKARLPTLEVRAIMLGHIVWPGSPIGDEDLVGRAWVEAAQHSEEQMLTGDDGKGVLCVHTAERISSKANSKLRWGPIYSEE